MCGRFCDDSQRTIEFTFFNIFDTRKMDTPQLPIELWTLIISYADDWDSGRAWIHDLLCVSKDFYWLTNERHEEMLIEVRNEFEDKRTKVKVSMRIRDRPDEHWFICHICSFLCMTKENVTYQHKCNRCLRNPWYDDLDTVVMLDGFNQRVAQSNNEMYICHECKLLVVVDYESHYMQKYVPLEASLLRYDEEGHIATFCPDCTFRCSY